MARLYIITGAMAAGKSTVARALVERYEKAAHVGGDAFLHMIAKGRAVMGPVLDAEAVSQLRLRQDVAVDTVRRFVGAGFTTVYQDILIGEDLIRITHELSDLQPRVVVLNPTVEVLSRRDQQRSKTGYNEGFPASVLSKALQQLTPRDGLWLDTSQMTVEETVDAIISAYGTG